MSGERERLLELLDRDGVPRRRAFLLGALGRLRALAARGVVRGDLAPVMGEPPPLPSKIWRLRAFGPTPAASYFRGKSAARSGADLRALPVLADDVAFAVAAVELSLLEVEMLWDVAEGVSDGEAGERASEAAARYERLVAAVVARRGSP